MYLFLGVVCSWETRYFSGNQGCVLYVTHIINFQARLLQVSYTTISYPGEQLNYCFLTSEH